MPPSCTTSAQKPGRQRQTAVVRIARRQAFAAGFGAAALTQRDRTGRTDTRKHKREKYAFHGDELYRLPNEGAMNARQHPGGILAATLADEIQIAARSERHTFALRLFEAREIDADRIAAFDESRRACRRSSVRFDRSAIQRPSGDTAAPVMRTFSFSVRNSVSVPVSPAFWDAPNGRRAAERLW